VLSWFAVLFVAAAAERHGLPMLRFVCPSRRSNKLSAMLAARQLQVPPALPRQAGRTGGNQSGCSSSRYHHVGLDCAWSPATAQRHWRLQLVHHHWHCAAPAAAAHSLPPLDNPTFVLHATEPPVSPRAVSKSLNVRQLSLALLAGAWPRTSLLHNSFQPGSPQLCAPAHTEVPVHAAEGAWLQPSASAASWP